MKNRFLIIFLGIIISLFGVKYALAALSTIDPANISVSNIGEGSVTLGWKYNENSADIKQFKILWRRKTANSTEAWTASYPSSYGNSPYSYSLRGLEASTNYEWRIKAEAKDPVNDSVYSDGPAFTTKASQWVTAPGSGGTGNGSNGNGSNGSNNSNPTIGNLLENTVSIQGATDSVINFATSTGFVIGPILILYAAFIMMTERGNPEALTKAKNIILWTVISLSVILFAKGIPAVVKGLL